MRFQGGDVFGACVVEMDRRQDERGFFGRLFCNQEFANAGLEHSFVQVNDSLNVRRGTLRGLHYQLPPAAEVKLVRCIRGSIFDVVADLRPDSPTYGRWFGAELNNDNRRMMYVPRGCAHGFLTLTDDAEALYFASAAYAPAQERGLRFDDAWLDIKWPADPVELSVKDQSWPAFDPAYHAVEAMRGLLGTKEAAE